MVKKLLQHRFLFEELVKRDFKKKYKRTVLGMAWSVLSPLLTLLVMRFERFGFIVLAVALYLGVLNPMIYGMQNLLYKALFFLSGGALL